jgi:hypothetical protein
MSDINGFFEAAEGLVNTTPSARIDLANGEATSDHEYLLRVYRGLP